MGASLVETPGAGAAATVVDEAALKFALLSVYYASVDDEFTVSGAPSAFVPPEVDPLPLAKALEVLSVDRPRLEQALWQIVRNRPLRQAWETRSRYPEEIDPYLTPRNQQRLDTRRAEYRKGASVLAACLRACHHDDRDLFAALRSAVATEAISENRGFRRVTRLLFDQTPEEFVDWMGEISDESAGDQWLQAQRRISAIEAEVGLGIAGYVEYLAATAAYESFTDGADPVGVHVYPVASVIRQSTGQLWTSATVTTLVHGPFEALRFATEPGNWHLGSDVVRVSHYVDDPTKLNPVSTDLGTHGEVHGLLFEEAELTWGRDATQQSRFRNVLNVNRRVRARGTRDDPRSIDVRFSLCRSIDSEVLWDSRAGGILLNEGFMKVVELGGDRWRVTSRKLLRFSDRTPYSGASGWTDFGQLLNYLAPAALTWWVETETYSLGRRTDPGGVRAEDSGSEDGRDG